jgi:hypothetical protein
MEPISAAASEAISPSVEKEKSNLTNIEKVEQPQLAKHDSSILDLAFVMDCTGSMGSYIHSATEVTLK